MPDFSSGGVNGTATRPTAEQVNCLVEFLNYADGDASAYFASVDPTQNPVLYTMIPGADAAAGEVFYAGACEGCHGAPEEFVLGYLEGDGKYSELAHKARWGNPPTEMTRDAMGDPTAQNVADMLLYLQQLGGTGFAMNAGLNGNWKEAANASLYQGFQLEVSKQGDGLVLVATFYTYNTVGEQVWLLGVGPVNGNTADVTVYIYSGPSWGAGYDPADAVETEWGTGVFTAASCGSVSMMLQPNTAQQGMGFTDIAQDLVRVTTPAMPCPMVVQN
jgi:mono/diheme cytochrome c family protein